MIFRGLIVLCGFLLTPIVVALNTVYCLAICIYTRVTLPHVFCINCVILQFPPTDQQVMINRLCYDNFFAESDQPRAPS